MWAWDGTDWVPVHSTSNILGRVLNHVYGLAGPSGQKNVGIQTFARSGGFIKTTTRTTFGIKTSDDALGQHWTNANAQVATFTQSGTVGTWHTYATDAALQARSGPCLMTTSPSSTATGKMYVRAAGAWREINACGGGRAEDLHRHRGRRRHAPAAPAGGFSDGDQYIRTDNGQIWEFAGGQWRRMTVLVAGGQVQAVYKVAKNIPARTLRLTPGDTHKDPDGQPARATSTPRVTSRATIHTESITFEQDHLYEIVVLGDNPATFNPPLPDLGAGDRRPGDGPARCDGGAEVGRVEPGMRWDADDRRLLGAPEVRHGRHVYTPAEERLVEYTGHRQAGDQVVVDSR